MPTIQPDPQTEDPNWYKDVIIYQLHVKSFCDGNGDGIGDFKGLLSRLDYLEKLGVTAIWLLPFYPSPLRDDGYDIADYTKVHPDYGTLSDFQRFMNEAHARGMRVITELVLNHTSDQHDWFQRARNARPGTNSRNFYVWSDTSEEYPEARIIFQDFELSNWTWDPVAGAYFWHRFYSHQPDLNFDNPKVHEALFKVLDFWFARGVDGVRLDAIPYLYEREGTNCENLPETYEFIKKLRRHVEKRYPDRMLLAEANQWPEDAAKYFGDGNGCHMCFHFPLMPRMYMALEMENIYPITDILEQTPAIPDACQWALFLRNHDELTLEMVTDEERDYMYRIYVKDPRARVNLGIRRRLAPLLDNDRRKIELMNVLLLTMPGSPIIYYGDEFGMGDNYYLGDRDGVRTPMQWNTDANAGFSRANPQKLFLPLVIDPEYNYTSLNVETQEERKSSLLWWMRSIIDLRKSHRCFGRGTIRFLRPDNTKVLCYIRSDGSEDICVVVNLSHHAQMVQLDLSDYAGRIPEDLFSSNQFLAVDKSPYSLGLNPYGYYILKLTEPGTGLGLSKASLPRLYGREWPAVLDDKKIRAAIENRILPSYLPQQRWYGGKARKIRKINIRDWIPFSQTPDTPILMLVDITYHEGTPELYILPLAYHAEDKEQTGEDIVMPRGSMAWLSLATSAGPIYEAVYSEKFGVDVLSVIAGRKRPSGSHGRLHAAASRQVIRLWKNKHADLTPRLLTAEQSNTSIRYGDQFIFKLYRRTDTGIHPDVEMVRYLTEKSGFTHIPGYAGSLEYRNDQNEPVVLGLMQHYIANQGDAWQLFLDLANRYFDSALTRLMAGETPPAKKPASLIPSTRASLPEPFAEIMSGVTLEMARLLGQRTAEMHLALARSREESFRPEAFSSLYQRALFQAMQNLTNQELRQLAKFCHRLPESLQNEVGRVLALQKEILAQMRRITGSRLPTKKIRIHGDYHLGQVLFTGSDFAIFDFEGEPVRPLTERRIKRSPMRDVAGMIRSFHYAAYTALLTGSTVRQQDMEALSAWADLWYRYVSADFLHGYLTTMNGSDLLPEEPELLENLLVPYLLEKAVYEVGYELNNRPDWLMIPLRGIQQLCGG
ncbi:MAG: maltose alpha-D-glucosyltransferase [Desulfuromonadales bacterium]|nr:maltose alpha-D-glucosyltransferase [Desulfuromonadales bacterium]